MPLLLLLGGARSGKSTLAVSLACAQPHPVVFVATAEALDDDRAGRIARHRDERPAAWTTVEEPRALAVALAAAPARACVIVDCLTLWAANLLGDGLAASEIERLSGEAAAVAARRDGWTIAVSNEVGLGIVPANDLARSGAGLARGARMTALVANLRALGAAVAFLTRLPVGRLVNFDGDDVARAGLYFPVVGAGLGALAGAIAQSLEHRLSAPLAAAIAVGVLAAATGAFHLDAVADTADALGGRDREHSLAVMRDHAIGAYGGVALIVDLVLRTTALAALASRHHAVVAALAAGALSRASAPVTGSLLPYARAGGGKGASLTGSSLARAGGAVLLAAGAAVGFGGATGAVMLAVAAAATGALALVWRRWLGGVTGDTLGAGIEVTELLSLIAAVALTSPRVAL